MMVESAQAVGQNRPRKASARKSNKTGSLQNSNNQIGQQQQPKRQQVESNTKDGKSDRLKVPTQRAQLERPSSTCDSLIVNNQTLDFRLRWVERSLTQLVKEETLLEDEEGHLDDKPCSSGSSSSSSSVSGGSFPATSWSARFDRDRARIKGMLSIYAKLLRCPPPLEVVLRQTSSIDNKPLSTRLAREEVLKLIERLGGYCDSINLLRCILKSSQMSAVISVFDTMLEKIRGVNSISAHNFLPPIEESHEFRIVQEWRF